ncbi:MAG: copper amine oxidase [Bacilli bacterium]|nr:copper amine oxidase [Bacilli bacterium]
MNLQNVKKEMPIWKKLTRLIVATTLVAVTLQTFSFGGGTALAATKTTTTKTTAKAKPTPRPTPKPVPTLSVPAWVNTKQEPITSGAYLRNYVWSAIRGDKEIHSDVAIVEVDLQNPNVKMDVMTGKNSQVANVQSVRGMATETGAVAGTNGDFFNTQTVGVPMGAEIAQGQIVTTPQWGTPGFYSFAIDKDNKPVIDLFAFQGTVQTVDGATYNLDGVNKSYYWTEVPYVHHAMDNSMIIYTNAWADEVRALDRQTDLIEVLVENNIIKEITDSGYLHEIAPKDGYILRTEGISAGFVKQHMKVGDPLKTQYSLTPVDSSKQYDTKGFKMMISGQTILVDGGKQTAFSRVDADLGGYRSRTGVGYSKDGRYAYMITVEASGDSSGASLAEFQQIMVAAGIWKGMNLDGGGSTQMVARPLGESTTQLVNQTENSYERPIANGLGVFSLAPKGTTVKGLILTGPAAVFLNEKAVFTAKGYDEYYNPIEVPASVQWTSPNAKGTFTQNIFTANQIGTAKITASLGAASQSMNVQVLNRADISSLTLVPSTSYLSEGASIQLSLKLKTKTGIVRTISAEGFPMELTGFKGEITGNTVHVTSLAGSSMGQITVHYDGFSSMLTLPIGQKKLWTDFSKIDFPITFLKTPNEVTGLAENVTGLISGDPNNSAVRLKYDFTQGTGTKAAYAGFGDVNVGVNVYGEPQGISLRVYGDNSLNMLRAEVIDADNDKNLIDLAKNINWSDWKTIEADLTQYHLTYPIKITKIYVASPELGQDERQKIGEIAFDDISFHYKNDLPQLSKNQVQLTINKKTMLVNGSKISIDQPPVIVNGSTLVPVRFVIEQLGGTVKWDPTERKVTILRGSDLIDFWVDQTNFNMDGNAATALVAPQILNNRTMVPLRVLTEKLGWKVTWDEKTKTVLLK